MNNIQVDVKGNKLTFTVDISPATIKKSPQSKSGKNTLVATSGGNQPVASINGMQFGLNVFCK